MLSQDGGACFHQSPFMYVEETIDNILRCERTRFLVKAFYKRGTSLSAPTYEMRIEFQQAEQNNK